MFAQAFETYAAYREFPYAIRRRRADRPGEERIRLSEAVRDVQTKLSYFLAWTAAESSRVGDAYAVLIAETRRVAGGAMHEAWAAAPIDSDEAMNFRPGMVDLSGLKLLEESYTKAVRHHLDDLSPWWAR